MRNCIYFFIAAAFVLEPELGHAGRTQRQDPSCLSSALESVAQGQNAARRQREKRAKVPEPSIGDARLTQEALDEIELREMEGRSFSKVVQAAEAGEFLGVPREQLQNELRMVRMIEKIDARGSATLDGLDELKHFLVHTMGMPGQFEYLGNSGTRVSLRWRKPGGAEQVIKLPRFQRIFETRYRARLARERVPAIVLGEKGVTPEQALKRAKKEAADTPVPPLSEQSYAEYLATREYVEALQQREDRLMALLSRRGIQTAPGSVLSGNLETLSLLGGRVSEFVAGPTLREAITAYRKKVGGGVLDASALPPLFREVLQFEDEIAGRPVKDPKYAALRQEILKQDGQFAFESATVGPLLMRGEVEREVVLVDLQAGGNTKVDSRFWSRTAAGELTPQVQCVGALLLWVGTGKQAKCINLVVSEIPRLIDG